MKFAKSNVKMQHFLSSQITVKIIIGYVVLVASRRLYLIFAQLLTMPVSAKLAAKHKDVNPYVLFKWERIFNAFFDRDAGGDVNWKDFYLVIHKVKNIYGAESVQMTYAEKSMDSLFKGLLGMADKNKDKIITIDEWVNCLKKGDHKDTAWFKDYCNYMFKLFDVSADDFLDIAEYTDGMSAYGFGSCDAHAAFKAFAKDKNGQAIKKLDYFQWRDRFNEYFFSADKNVLGNHLFGVLA